jgi:hypothetical protein
MAAVETFANQPAATVTSGGTTAPSSGTPETWTVSVTAAFPAAATGATQFHVADTAAGKTGEIIAVTNVSGSTWTVTRGAESSTTVAHTAGFTVVQVVSAGALGGLLQAPNNLSDVTSASAARTNLGLTGAATASLPLSIPNGGSGTAAGAPQNGVFAGPASGGAGAPAFRALVASDVPGAGATGGLLAANNLSDLANATTSRVNLGATWKDPVQQAQIGALPANTYSAGVLTATGNAVLVVDGVTCAAGQRIMVAGEATAQNNGIYAVTQPGSSGTPYILTRSADMATGVLVTGATVMVEQGTAAAGSGWFLAGAGPDVIGTTALFWTKFTQIISGSNPQALGNAAPGVTGFVSDSGHVHPMTGLLPLTGGTLTGSLTVGGALSTTPVTLTDAATITVNAALSDYFRVTLGGNRTLASPSNPADGQAICFEIIQDGTGSRTLAYGGAYSFPSSIGTPVLSTTAGYHDFLAFRYDAAVTTWYCVGFVPQSTAAAAATVAQGGTGDTSLTAWSLLAGGTTSTGPVQSLAALGTSGWPLLSGGAGALPSFQALDSTASDIAAAGAQGAGATGKIPDAGHVHPDTYGGMGGLGTLLGWTLPWAMTSTTYSPSAGVLQLARIRVPVGGTANNFYMFISTAGATPANVYIALLNLSGTFLASSVNRAADTALTTSGALWTVPFQSGAALTAGDYYGVLLVGSAGTMPLFRAGGSTSSAVVNLGTTAAAVTLRAAGTGSGLTALPGSVTMSGLSANAGSLWMAVGP